MNINWEILMKVCKRKDLHEVCSTSSQISERSTVANPGHFFQTCHFKPQFHNCNINGDKCWVLQYHTETKCQTVGWRANSPLRAKTSTCKSQGPKSILSCLFFYYNQQMHNYLIKIHVTSHLCNLHKRLLSHIRLWDYFAFVGYNKRCKVHVLK